MKSAYELKNSEVVAAGGKQAPVSKHPFRLESLALWRNVALVFVPHGQHPYIYFSVTNHLDPFLAPAYSLAPRISHLQTSHIPHCLPLRVVLDKLQSKRQTQLLHVERAKVCRLM